MINSPSQGNEGLMDNFGKMARRLSLALLLTGAAAPFSAAQASPQESQTANASEAVKKAKAKLGEEFICFVTGDNKTPEEAAVAMFAIDTGLTAAEVKAAFVPEIVKTQTDGIRRTVAKMLRKGATSAETPMKKAESKLGEEFICFVTGDNKTPEQAAVAKFAYDTGLTVAEVEAAFVPEILKTQAEGARRTKARMTKKTTMEKMPNQPIANHATEDNSNKQAAVQAFMEKVGEKIVKMDEESKEKEKAKKIIVENLIDNFIDKRLNTAYEKALKRNPTLKGVFSLYFKIGKNGKMETLEFRKDTFENRDFTKRVNSTLRNIQFPKQAEPIEFEASFALTTTTDSEGTEMEMERANDLVKNFIKKRVGAAYEGMLKRDPTLKGSVQIYLRIGTNGGVELLKFKKDTFGNEDFTERIKSAIQNIKFPQQTQPIEFEFPLILSPGGTN